jgi:hypothetical protein
MRHQTYRPSNHSSVTAHQTPSLSRAAGWLECAIGTGHSEARRGQATGGRGGCVLARADRTPGGQEALHLAVLVPGRPLRGVISCLEAQTGLWAAVRRPSAWAAQCLSRLFARACSKRRSCERAIAVFPYTSPKRKRACARDVACSRLRGAAMAWQNRRAASRGLQRAANPA